jgi:histidine triad (HIT) family protein
MRDCLFCRIARHDVPAVVLYEDADVMAFLDRTPIRPAHTQVIPKIHLPTFEELPEQLASKLLHTGQQLARRMKDVYEVERVAFLFTGGDVPHAHAHVIPMHEKTDITSGRYLVSPSQPEWGSDHLKVDPGELARVKQELGFEVKPVTVEIPPPPSRP